MRTKEILDDDGDAELSAKEIRQALSGIVCRCTGYQQIVDSVQAAQKAYGAGMQPSVVPSGSTATEEGPIELVDTDRAGEAAYDNEKEH
jgi:xanthine dehydrogenase iron-sulfur cluster and FAD-binding subunit A